MSDDRFDNNNPPREKVVSWLGNKPLTSEEIQKFADEYAKKFGVEQRDESRRPVRKREGKHI